MNPPVEAAPSTRAGVSVQEVAAALGLSLPTVKRWVASGKLEAVRVGRRVVILRPALERALGTEGAAAVLAAATARGPAPEPGEADA